MSQSQCMALRLCASGSALGVCVVSWSYPCYAVTAELGVPIVYAAASGCPFIPCCKFGRMTAPIVVSLRDRRQISVCVAGLIISIPGKGFHSRASF